MDGRANEQSQTGGMELTFRQGRVGNTRDFRLQDQDMGKGHQPGQWGDRLAV